MSDYTYCTKCLTELFQESFALAAIFITVCDYFREKTPFTYFEKTDYRTQELLFDLEMRHLVHTTDQGQYTFAVPNIKKRVDKKSKEVSCFCGCQNP